MNKFFHLLISLIIGLITTLIAIRVGFYIHDYLHPNTLENEGTIFDFVIPLGIIAIIGSIGISLFSTMGYFLTKKKFATKDIK